MMITRRRISFILPLLSESDLPRLRLGDASFEFSGFPMLSPVQVIPIHGSDQDNRSDAKQNALDVLLLPGRLGEFFHLQLLLYDHFCFFIRDAGTPYQKPVGIDAKRRAGYQGADIFPFRYSQIGSVMRQDRIDLIHLIS